jgi:hypothetical protein
MKETLFNPKKIDLPQHLILIPQFWDKVYYEKLKEEALAFFNLLQSDLVMFENYTLIVGFLGYPSILTLLEFVNQVRDKNIYFLGTAGVLNESITKPIPLNPTRVYPTSILEHFSNDEYLDLKPFEDNAIQEVIGVTVDIIQRETSPWLKEQVSKGIDFVEMELFPLRVYLEKPFYSIVVASDLLKEDGINVFPDKDLLKKEFVKSFEYIKSHINKK